MHKYNITESESRWDPQYATS